jgi:hypothetical protein
VAGYDIARPTPDVDEQAANGAAARIAIRNFGIFLSFKARRRYLTSRKQRSQCLK